MADSALPANSPTPLNPDDPDDGSSDGAAVDAIVVGVAGGDAGAGLVVGDPDLAASADSGGTADASGVLASPLPLVASSGGADGAADSAAQISGSVVAGGVAVESADGAAPGNEAPIGSVSVNRDPGPTVSGGTAGITTVDGGSGTVVSGGSTNLEPISGGAAPTTAAGTAGTTTISNGGLLTVPSGGSTSLGTASSGGPLPVAAGSGVISGDLTINLVYDSAAQAAPASFRAAMQSGADILEAAILNPIVVNIEVGYGEFNGSALPSQSISEGAIGYQGNVGSGISESYSSLRALLASTDTSSAHGISVNALPTGTSLDGVSNFTIGSAEAKALVALNVTDPSIDGFVGMGTGFGASLVGAALHEIAHAMGRVPGDTALSLFRYTSSGAHDFAGGSTPAAPSYFSIDGGATVLANFGIKSDPSDFLNSPASTLTPNDPFDENIGGNQLTPQDFAMIEVLGFFVNPYETFTAAYIEALTTSAIALLATDGITSVAATDTSVVLTSAQVTALAAASITVTAPSGDTVTVGDLTAADVEALTPSQISALVSSGVTAVASTDASVVLTVAQAVALEAGPLRVTAPSGDTVTIADTAAHIKSLTAGEITALPRIGVTAVAATDASVVLTVSQGLALAAASIPVTVPTGDSVTVTDTVAKILALTSGQVGELFVSAGVTAVTIADTAAHIEAITAAALTNFPQVPITAIASTNASVALTVGQAVAIEGDYLPVVLAVTVPAGDTVTIADTAANIESLAAAGTPGSIAGLPAIGVSAIRATDTSVALTTAQAVALEAASLALTVPAGFTVTIYDQNGGGEIESLTPGEIDALPSIHVTAITDVLNEFPLLLTVGQALALEALGITVSENLRTNLNFPYVYDTAANIASLTAAEIAALPGIGFDAIWASDSSNYPQGIPLSVAQVLALENASLFVRGQSLFSPVLDIVDAAGNIEMLTAVQILKLPAISKVAFDFAFTESGPIYFTSTGQPLGFTVSQVDAFLQTGFGFAFAVEGGGAVTVSDTAALIDAFISLHTQTQLQGLAGEGFTGFAAIDASLQLSLADALKLEGASLVATAPSGDTVTIYDYSFVIEGLTTSEIAALRSIGVTAITASEASVVLTVAQAVALEGARLVVTAGGGGTVTISDTIANTLSLTSGQLAGLAAIGVTGVSVADTAGDIEALTSAEIAALKAIGITMIAATDASVQLTVAQATALEDPVRVTAPLGDTVTIADTIATVDALTAGQFAALSSIGVSAVTVSDTAAAIEALTLSQITTLTGLGVTRIIATDASVHLTAAQAVAFEGTSLVVGAPAGDTVTIRDTAADIAGLTPSEITALTAIGVTAIAASDASVHLTVAQAVVLEGTPLVVGAPAGDTVTILDTAADIESLNASEIATLPAAGVTGAGASDASVQFIVAQAVALEGSSLKVTAPVGDTVTVVDTAADIESLSASEISALPATGITAIAASDVSVVLSVAQAQAFEGASLVVTAPAADTVTVSDTEAAVDTLTAAQTAALPAIGVSGIAVASLTGLAPITIDGGITLTVDGGVSSNQTITFSGAGGVLGLADPPAMSGTVSGFASADTIDLTGAVYDPSAIANPQPGNVVEVVENSGDYFINFDPSQDFLSENFAVGPDQNGGTDLTLVQVPLTSSATVPAGEAVYGITVANGGTVDVLAGGTLSGGTVSSGGTLDVESGATAAGATIDDGGTQNVAAGGTANDTVLDGSATQDVSGTASVTTVESGDSQLVEAGGLAISTTVQSGGTEIVAAGGTTSNTAIGGGTLDVESGGIVSGSITFTAGAGGTLQIDGAAPPTDPTPVIGGVISGFLAGDMIDLTGIAFDSAGSATLVNSSGVQNQLQITESGATYDLNLDPARNFTGDFFNLGDDGAPQHGTLVTENNTACFCRGTLIRTPSGEVAVEDLAVGDWVATSSGGVKPIVWIGFGRDLVTRANRLARPIVVRRGALADNVPQRDLYLTHGHALYLEDVLIPVENLVNHRSILWDDNAGVVGYYHIELAEHDVVFAEGAPAETYYDADNRAQFQNTRPGSEAGAAKPTFAPVLNGGEIVEQTWTKLFHRSGGEIERDTTDDPDLHLVVAGERLDPAVIDRTTYTFELAEPPAGLARLCSRVGVPSLLGIARHDHRRLGVAITRIDLCQPGIATSFACAAPLFMAGGCYPAETGYCWTDGELVVPSRLFSHMSGALTLTVHTERPAMRYPVPARLTKAA